MWKEYPQYYEVYLWTDFTWFLGCLTGGAYLLYKLAKWHDSQF